MLVLFRMNHPNGLGTKATCLVGICEALLELGLIDVGHDI